METDQTLLSETPKKKLFIKSVPRFNLARTVKLLHNAWTCTRRNPKREREERWRNGGMEAKNFE